MIYVILVLSIIAIALEVYRNWFLNSTSISGKTTITVTNDLNLSGNNFLSVGNELLRIVSVDEHTITVESYKGLLYD